MGEDGLTLSPSDLNDRGRVVGTASTESSRHVFSWKNGRFRLLEELSFPEAQATWINAINNRGQMVGEILDQGWTPHGFLYDRRGLTELDPFAFSSPWEINDRGQVLGVSLGATTLPAVWQNGMVTTLPLAPGHEWSTPIRMNNRGTVAGTGYGESTDAVVWFAPYNQATVLPKPAVGEITSDALVAAVNDRDEVLVSYAIDFQNRSFIWSRNHPTLEMLRPLPNYIHYWTAGMNDEGIVIGVASNGPTETNTPVVWREDEICRLADLVRTQVNGQWTHVAKINQQGEILAFLESTNHTMWYVLRPIGR
jgi:uncharacterized membrane protein